MGRERRASALLLVAFAAALLAGCKTRWDVEAREATLDVWLEAPAAANQDLTIPISIFVGEQRVVDRPVRFPKGQTRVAVPPVYVKSTPQEVVIRINGREVARRGVAVEHHAWLYVRFVGDGAEMNLLSREPGSR